MLHLLLSTPPARRARALLLALLLPLLSLFLLSRALPARAAGVVGSGTPASCTDSALLDALNGGGLVTFDCGPLPATILITETNGLLFAPDATLDGGDLITLSGGQANRLFFVNSGQTVTLTHIILANGLPASGPGGAIYNAGHTVLDHATLRGNAVNPQAGGGAIYDAPGAALEVRHSLLANNASYGGGAISNDAGANLIVADSQFLSNSSWAYFGGAIYNLGSATLTDSLLSGNLVSRTVSVYANDQGGAGLANTSTGTAIIANTTFMANRVVNEEGGAIFNLGELELSGGALNQNSAGLGGGLFTKSTTTLSGATFDGNQSGGGGAVEVSHTPISMQDLTFTNNFSSGYGGAIESSLSISMVVTHSTFRGNSAGLSGGAIYLFSANLAATGSTFDGNSAGSEGGAIFGSCCVTLADSTLTRNHAANGGALSLDSDFIHLTTSTLAGNSADGLGGAIYAPNGTVSLENVTLSGNAASDGGGLHTSATTTLRNVTFYGNAATHGGALYRQSGSLTLQNTLIDSSLSGGNCAGAGGSLSSSFTLSSDNTCALSGTGDQIGLALKLSGLGNYGGPTQTHMPAADSPAVDGIIGNDAPDHDQRGVARPQIGGFDIGAVERQLTDSSLIPRLFLALVRR